MCIVIRWLLIRFRWFRCVSGCWLCSLIELLIFCVVLCVCRWICMFSWLDSMCMCLKLVLLMVYGVCGVNEVLISGLLCYWLCSLLVLVKYLLLVFV